MLPFHNPRKSITETTTEEFMQITNVNQVGGFLGMKYCAPELIKNKGAIVLVGDALGPSNQGPAYAASKGAIRILCKNAAALWASEGVRVNLVSPGAIETKMLECVDTNKVVNENALKRLGKPEEIASVIAFLASPEASFCTGSEFTVDGGQSAL